MRSAEDHGSTLGLDERRGALRASGWWSPPRMRALLTGLGCLALAAAALLAWDLTKYRVIAKRWGVVVPGKIYRSGQLSRWVLEDQFAEHGIVEVIDLNGVEPADEHQAHEIEFMEREGLTLHRFALGGDGRGEIERYADAIETMVAAVKSGRPILVHCSAGAQRTGGVIASYRVLVEGRSTAEVVAEMRQYGWRPDRDEELVPYLNENLETLARLLVERGVIARVPEPLPRFGS